jgi:hypothetical protein
MNLPLARVLQQPTSTTTTPPSLTALVEIPQIRRRLIFFGRHQQTIRTREIVSLQDRAEAVGAFFEQNRVGAIALRKQPGQRAIPRSNGASLSFDQRRVVLGRMCDLLS